MILDSDTDNKIRALHSVLIRARTQAYCGMDNKTLGRILDDAEYLATRIFAPDPSEPGEFRAMLQYIEQQYEGFKAITEVYDNATLSHVPK